VLALAAGGLGETIFIEPAAVDEHEPVTARPPRHKHYAIVVERGTSSTRISIDGAVAAATVARLAFIADLDLATNHAVSGVVRTRAGTAYPAEVVVTVRPGSTLRADVTALPRNRASRPSMPTIGVELGPAPGAIVGSYRVLEKLGEGGMGTVFRAEHVVLKRHHALKVLRKKLLEHDPTAAHRFLREARAAARVHHPNIVDVFDFGHLPDGRPYFVMELMTGRSLYDVLGEGSLLPGDAVAVARQLASALAAAHDAGVIHADVTPANVYVIDQSNTPIVKLLDFGLAEFVGESAYGSDAGDGHPNFVLGTPSYISPEQLRGLPATDRSDQYSLGALLFEMLAGAPPYVDPDLRELCMKHLSAPVPELTSRFGPLPPALIDAVATCLAKAPQARFPGMRALVAALDEIEQITDRSGWRRFLPT